MLLPIDQQVEVLALLVSLESLGAPLSLLLVCKGLRRDAAAVMPALNAKRGLPWTSVTSVLQKFRKAKHAKRYLRRKGDSEKGEIEQTWSAFAAKWWLAAPWATECKTASAQSKTKTHR